MNYLYFGMSIRKSTGGPDGKYYESSETIAKFETVRQWLVKNCKKVGINLNNNYIICLVTATILHQFTQTDPPNNKLLANLTCSMLQFQEVCCCYSMKLIIIVGVFKKYV